MAIVLIIEDGSGVPFANSYVTVDEARSYAAARAIDLPVSDDDLAPLLINGYEFMASYECRFAGCRSFPEIQTGPFPRTGVYVYSVPMVDNMIPAIVKVAQIQIAVAAESGITLFPTQTGAAVKRETVGPLTKEYDSASWLGSELPVLSNVELTLKPLFAGDSCGGFTLRTIRV